MVRKYKIIYFITFIVALCSILYELLMAQTLTILTGNAVARYSVTLGLYLAAMGIGAFLCRGKIAENPLQSLIVVEILLSLFGVICVPMMHAATMLNRYYAAYDYFYFSIFIFFLISHGVIVLVGLLTGFELPLLINLNKKEEPEKNTANLVLGIDYFGALAGALMFPVILLPALGVFKISFLVALLNAFAALFLIIIEIYREGRKGLAYGAVNCLVIIFIVSGSFYSSKIEQYFLKKYYYYYDTLADMKDLFNPMNDKSIVERYRSPYQNIDIVYYPSETEFLTYLLAPVYSRKFEKEPDAPFDYYLFLNGDFQFLTSVEELYHEVFAHIPIIVNHVPKKVLVLGGGDGMLIRELLKYKQIESITHIELDKEMIKLAKHHKLLHKLNKDSLYNPKVNEILGDGYQYVRNTTEKYDAIYIDFPAPVNYNLAKLYSREFYYFVRKCLTDDGFAALDAPGSMILEELNDWDIYYNTIKAAGFKTVVPYVSVLEQDNPDVINTLIQQDIILEEPSYPGMEGEENVITDEKEKMQAVTQLISEYVFSIYQGFIFMRADGKPVNPAWKDNGIEYYILNKKRFELAFSLPYTSSKNINYDKVNSIMRPTLPNLPFWYTRLPF